MIKAYLGEGGEWVLDVLGNPWGGPNGGKDTHGEFFSPRTQFHEDRYGLPPVVYYHGYDPVTKRPMGEPAYIGKTVGREVRADGVWYKVVLDKTKALAKNVWDAAQRLAAVASTGTVEHLARVNKATGEILHWPVVELSTWGLETGVHAPPANSYAVAIPAIKALYSAAGMDLPAECIDQSINQPNKENNSMDPEEIQKLIAEGVASAIKSQQDAAAAEVRAKADQDALIQSAVESALKADREQRAGDRRLPDGGQVYMDGQAPYAAKFGDVRRYDNLEPADCAMMVDLLSSAKRSGHSRRGASEAAIKAAAIKLAEDKHEGSAHARSSMKAMGIDPRDLLDAARSATKANELMHNTQTGYGDEWVGQGYSTQIWQAVRAETFVIDNLMSRGMAIEAKPSEETFTIPLEGADPTWYKVGATTDLNATTGRPDATVTASKAATGSVPHALAKAGARTVFNGELEEDSLIPVVPQLRRQIQTSGAEQLEHACIDGDTVTTSSNINNGGGSSLTNNLFLLFNGFRKSALVTTAANSRDAGSLTDDDFLETAYLMGTAGLIGSDRRKVDFIIDPNVHKAAVKLASVKTRDVFKDATIENGLLMAIWGYRVWCSYFMHYASAKRMAQSTGKVHVTDSNNTTGSIVAVRWDQWAMGWRRRVTIETTRYANADATEIMALMRLGLVQRDTEASAVSYNVTV